MQNLQLRSPKPLYLITSLCFLFINPEDRTHASSPVHHAHYHVQLYISAFEKTLSCLIMFSFLWVSFDHGTHECVCWGRGSPLIVELATLYRKKERGTDERDVDFTFRVKKEV